MLALRTRVGTARRRAAGRGWQAPAGSRGRAAGVPEVQEPLLEPAASTAARRSEREHVSDFYDTDLIGIVLNENEP